MNPTLPFDYASAWQYALTRLETELPPELSYHSASHTRDDVVPATEMLAALENVSGVDRYLLLTAAWYHDLGYIEDCAAHEAASARLAAAILPQFGYRPADIQIVSTLIMATKLPQSPQTLLERIIADADLDSLGREDFWPLSKALRAELIAMGNDIPMREWLERQILFLRQHRYFTTAAQKLRRSGKQKNIAFLKAKLADL